MIAGLSRVNVPVEEAWSVLLDLDLGPRGPAQAPVPVQLDDGRALVGSQVVCAIGSADVAVPAGRSHARGGLAHPARDVEDGTPAASACEQVALRWCAELLELPAASGALVTGGQMANFVGLAIARKAYRIAPAGHEPPVIDGFTGLQRVLLGWAQVWRAVTRDEVQAFLAQIEPVLMMGDENPAAIAQQIHQCASRNPLLLFRMLLDLFLQRRIHHGVWLYSQCAAMRALYQPPALEIIQILADRNLRNLQIF